MDTISKSGFFCLFHRRRLMRMKRFVKFLKRVVTLSNLKTRRTKLKRLKKKVDDVDIQCHHRGRVLTVVVVDESIKVVQKVDREEAVQEVASVIESQEGVDREVTIERMESWTRARPLRVIMRSIVGRLRKKLKESERKKREMNTKVICRLPGHWSLTFRRQKTS